MKVITTADKFRVTEGQLVWLAWNNETPVVRKVGRINDNGTTYLADPIEGACVALAGSRAIRIYHPETGVKASDFAYDAEEVLV